MSLKAGKSQAVISANIRELLRSYKETGMIGNVKPKNIKEAVKIASAIAFTKSRGGRKRRESVFSKALKKR
jgi:hypothetical protein